MRDEAPSVAYLRRAIDDRVARLARRRGDRIRRGGLLTDRRYLAELARTAVVPSPFGYGELCYRDFEAFAAGCLVVKPDMRHLRTWPDYFAAEVSVLMHRWDLEDLDEVLERAVDDVGGYHDVAREGQRRLEWSLSPEGGRAFAARLRSIVDRAHDRARGAGRRPPSRQ